MKRYGVPYKGSKNQIVDWIVSFIPVTENFYDLFAGGCAVMHKQLERQKYKRYFANDLDYDGIKLFTDSINGKYTFETCKDWITREDFERLKNIDPYIKYCWSFGNNGRDYLYGKKIEEYKKAWDYAIFKNDYSLSKKLGFDLSASNDIKDIYQKYLFTKKIIKKSKILNMDKLQSLQNSERLQRLESLQSLQSLQLFNCSYEKVNIYKNSVLYCDIPYFETNSYGKKNINTFDYESFYKWAENQKELVIISEYYCPEDRFICIAETKKRSLICKDASKCTDRIEKLFIPKTQKSLYEKYKALNKYKYAKQLEFDFS